MPPCTPVDWPTGAQPLFICPQCIAMAPPLFTKKGNRALRRKFRKTVEAVDSYVDDRVQDVKDFTRKLWYGRNEFSPKAQRFLEAHGDKDIVEMWLNRDPVASAIKGILSVFGNMPYDQLFHLSLRGKLADNTRFMLEKIEVINIDDSFEGTAKGGDRLDIAGSHDFTLNEMLEAAKERMGDDFYKYSVYNNCQIFIKNCLEGVGIGQYTPWIVQPAKSIFKNSPNLRRFANTLTDIAGRADVLMQGAGLDDDDDEIEGGSFLAAGEHRGGSFLAAGQYRGGGLLCTQKRGRRGRLQRGGLL